jgi:hypothetical protein
MTDHEMILASCWTALTAVITMALLDVTGYGGGVFTAISFGAMVGSLSAAILGIILIAPQK